LRTSSLLQLRPGQDEAKQCDTNRVTHGINKRTVNNTIEKAINSVCKCSKIREVRQIGHSGEIINILQFNTRVIDVQKMNAQVEYWGAKEQQQQK
jgi:hypothetical protein